MGQGNGLNEMGQVVEVTRRDPRLLPLSAKLGRAVYHEGVKSILQMTTHRHVLALP